MSSHNLNVNELFGHVLAMAESGKERELTRTEMIELFGKLTVHFIQMAKRGDSSEFDLRDLGINFKED